MPKTKKTKPKRVELGEALFNKNDRYGKDYKNSVGNILCCVACNSGMTKTIITCPKCKFQYCFCTKCKSDVYLIIHGDECVFCKREFHDKIAKILSQNKDFIPSDPSEDLFGNETIYKFLDEKN